VARENSSDDSVVGKPSHLLETTLSTALSALVIVQAMELFDCRNFNQTASHRTISLNQRCSPQIVSSSRERPAHEAK
jgi:hypothetical protein